MIIDHIMNYPPVIKLILFQSHISENVHEVNEVLKQNPDCANYAEVYDKCGLLTNKVCICNV